jgi:hypothetical protein
MLSELKSSYMCNINPRIEGLLGEVILSPEKNSQDHKKQMPISLNPWLPNLGSSEATLIPIVSTFG